MSFPSFFVIAFLIAVVYLARQLVKTRGFRGVMFGARVVRTVGEIDLGRRRMNSTTVRVHHLDDGDSGPKIGVELFFRSIGGFKMVPIVLEREHALQLVGLLSQAVNDSGSVT